MSTRTSRMTLLASGGPYLRGGMGRTSHALRHFVNSVVRYELTVCVCVCVCVVMGINGDMCTCLSLVGDSQSPPLSDLADADYCHLRPSTGGCLSAADHHGEEGDMVVRCGGRVT